MREYRLYFLGPDGNFVGRRKFVAVDNAAALHAACCIYGQVPTPHHGFELWQERRCLYTGAEESRLREG